MDQKNEGYIKLSHIQKYYGNYKASDDINFEINKGSLVALLGPSGSGKTTILRMIAGLEQADGGEISIDGKVVNDIPASKRGIGFVFQNYALFRYMTVYDNIAFGLKVNKWSKEQIKERVTELIELVGLKGMEKRYPNQLSGGQRQRVAFARALAPNPDVLLLDEPFAAIDAKVRQELRSWLKDMIEKVGITSIFVTHDQDEAIEVADEIIITNHGRLEQIGSPQEIYRQPKTAFVAEFMGQPTKVEQINRFNGYEQLKDSVRAILRQENIVISKIGEPLRYTYSAERGIVERTLFRGKEIELTIRLNGNLIKGIRQIEDAPIEKGEEVNICIYRAYTYEEDGLIQPVWNANIETEESVVI